MKRARRILAALALAGGMTLALPSPASADPINYCGHGSSWSWSHNQRFLFFGNFGVEHWHRVRHYSFGFNTIYVSDGWVFCGEPHFHY